MAGPACNPSLMGSRGEKVTATGDLKNNQSKEGCVGERHGLSVTGLARPQYCLSIHASLLLKKS